MVANVFLFFVGIITDLGIGCKGTENILGTRFLHNVSKSFLSFLNYTVLHSGDTSLFYLEVHVYAQTGEQRTLDSHHLQGRNWYWVECALIALYDCALVRKLDEIAHHENLMMFTFETPSFYCKHQAVFMFALTVSKL